MQVNSSNVALQLTAFVAGASVMVLELVGIRMFAPFLGTSIIVWTCMIGIVMASLSVGYVLGGRMSNKTTSIHTLGYNMILAGGLTLLLTLIHEGVLVTLNELFLVTNAAILASIILFGPVNILFGTISPLAVQLYFNANKHAGSSAGTIYACSTIGSIAGTFGAGLVLIPLFGTFEILIAITCTLLLLGSALLLFKAPKSNIWAFPLVVLICCGLWMHKETLKTKTEIPIFSALISDTNTLYNRIRIWETDYYGTPVRVFMDWQSTMYTDPKRANELAIDYTRYYRLAEYFNPEFTTALAIGGAGYTFPRYFQYAYPDKYIDVVEIDPGMLPLAQKHFGFTAGPKFTNITEDARTYLNRTDKKYGAIYGDAFSKDSVVPFHLTTQEAMQTMYDALTDNGVLIMNVIAGTTGRNGEFFQMQYHTMNSVFPQVYALEVTPGSTTQNIMLIGLKSTQRPSFQAKDPVLQSYLNNLYTKRVEENIILTDNYAPVEYALLPVMKCLRDTNRKESCY